MKGSGEAGKAANLVAGNVLDAVRYIQGAKDRGIAGVVDSVAALLMKAPPRPMSESAALAGLRSLMEP